MNYRRIFTGALFIGSIFCFQNCEVFNADEQIPAWIEIDSITLVDNPNMNEGALSSDIKDAWISVDGNRIGTFELPCRVPVLAEGEHQITVSAGIFVSGKSIWRDDYLYYKKDSFNLNLHPNETYKLEPEITYQKSSSQTVILIEDFEDGEDRIYSTNTSDAKFLRIADPTLVKYGDGCGIQYINDSVDVAIVRTAGNLDLPLDGSTFLEIDYASDFPIEWGLYVNSRTSDQALEIRSFKSSDGKWKKQYIALDSCLTVAYNLYYPESFYIYAKTLIDDVSSPSSGSVRIDNLKVLFVNE